MEAIRIEFERGGIKVTYTPGEKEWLLLTVNPELIKKVPELGKCTEDFVVSLMRAAFERSCRER